MSQQREYWSSRSGFVLATLGSAVGLGNVWRFPFVCYDNGGGAFLVPYFVALLTTGIPLMILEYGLGHRMRTGAPGSLAKIHPKMQWLGWTQLLLSFVVVCYYAVVMAWCWTYLVHSFDVTWGGDAAAFFDERILGKTAGPLELGGLQWPLVIGLGVTWLCVFLSIVKGVSVVSKIVLITVPLPVLLLVVFVLRGITLPGAVEGLNFYLSPDFSVLTDPEVWLAAYGQIFFSLSLGFGVMISYASYLKPSSDVNNNAFISSLGNCSTSFFAGLAVFSSLGFLAQSTGRSVADVVASGPGLAFVTYPTIIDKLPGAPVFAVLFFVMLLTLGIDSSFSLVEGVVTGIDDRYSPSKAKIVGVVCILGFLGGLIFTTGAGLFWLDIVDHYLTYLALPFVGLAECLVVAAILKTPTLREHVNATSDFRIGRWWDLCIAVITPILLGAMFVIYFYRRVMEPYEGYPSLAQAVGGWLVLAGVTAGGVVMMVLARRENLEEETP